MGVEPGRGGLREGSGNSGVPRAQPGNDLKVFLLFGQSNMEGATAVEAQDEVIHERVFVLGYDDACLSRSYNEWSVAAPLLHRCFAGLGLGDWFGKALARDRKSVV